MLEKNSVINNDANSGTMVGNINGDFYNIGLGYKDVKDIFFDLFKQNFIAMKNEAMLLAENRVNEFFEKFVDDINKEKLLDLKELSKPDMQYLLL